MVQKFFGLDADSTVPLYLGWAMDENNTKGVLIKVVNQNKVDDQGDRI